MPVETPRFLLRFPRLSDLPALVPLVSDRRVAHPTMIPHPYPKNGGVKYTRDVQRNYRTGKGLGLLIFDKSDGRLVGGIGFHAIDWANRQSEVGYWVAPLDWGRGVAPEAAYAVCRAGFRTLRMHRISAGAFAFNARSARVLRKIGFRLEGRFREARRDGRKWVDVLRFGLLAEELRAPRKRP